MATGGLQSYAPQAVRLTINHESLFCPDVNPKDAWLVALEKIPPRLRWREIPNTGEHMNVQDAILYASLEQVQCLLHAVDDVQVVAWPLVMELLLCIREPPG